MNEIKVPFVNISGRFSIWQPLCQRSNKSVRTRRDHIHLERPPILRAVRAPPRTNRTLLWWAWHKSSLLHESQSVQTRAACKVNTVIYTEWASISSTTKKSAIFQTYSQSGGELQRDRKQGDSSGDLHLQSAPEGRPRQIFLQAAAHSQLLQKVLLRAEFIFLWTTGNSPHSRISVSALRCVNSGCGCLRALLLPCLLSAVVTVPSLHQQHGGRFGFMALSGGFKHIPAI